MDDVRKKMQQLLSPYLPGSTRGLTTESERYQEIARGVEALEKGTLSWSRLNQILHRCSEAGVSQGFFRYYFLEEPGRHPYPVDRVFDSHPFTPPRDPHEIKSLRQFEWGLRRFVYDAMLFWGNLRQAYRDLRQLSFEEIGALFATKRVDDEHLLQRGAVETPHQIERDRRYLISEMACKTYDKGADISESLHVQIAVDAFKDLRKAKKRVTPRVLKEQTERLAKGRNQFSLFELMYEDAAEEIRSQEEVVALYAGQWDAFRQAREIALENTRIYLSICSDLDVYVATSMRTRSDFRYMADACERIFSDPALAKYNIRYFDPTLSAANYHEDKGMIECLMVKTAKLLLYFAQNKESLGKVSEFAMALSQGKPAIVYCPEDEKGAELLKFYREGHPLMRLVDLRAGTTNGAIVTNNMSEVVALMDRILSNRMEYDLDVKEGSTGYLLLRERLTGSTVRVITDDRLLMETYWNNWHGIY